MTSTQFSGRLMVGLDGQDPDVHMFRYASMVARLGRLEHGRRLVAERTPTPPPAGIDPEVRFVYLFPPSAKSHEHSRRVLRERVMTYFSAPPECAAVGCDVLRGDAYRRLSATAVDFDCDLLLLGHSPRSPKACARVAMEAPCPVWLVPNGWAPVLRRLLVPCDFSVRSAAALRAAIDIAHRSRRAKCFVLHVSWTASRFVAADSPREYRLQRAFDEFMSGIDSLGVAIEPVFAEGISVEQQIERAANRLGVDLVVMCTRGRTQLARPVLPSITDLAIRRSQASFLVLRSGNRPVGVVEALRQRVCRPADIHFS